MFARLPAAVTCTLPVCLLLSFLLPTVLPAQPPPADPPSEDAAAGDADDTPRIEAPPITVTGSPPATRRLLTPTRTGSRLDVSAFALPLSVETLDHQAIADRGGRTVVEAVGGTTGLVGAVRAGAPGVYSWRGFTENAVATLYNGIRVQGSTVTTRTYDAFAFDRIEVVRGAASGLHGEGALAGAINYVRRRPARSADQQVDALVSAGSYGSIRTAIGTNGRLWDGAHYRVDVVRHRFDTSIEDNENRFTHVVGSLLVDLGADVSLLFESDVLRNRVEQAYWGTPLVDGRLDPALARVNYNTARDNRYRDDVTWLRLEASWSPSERVSLSNQLYRYDATRDWRNIGRFLYNADTGTVGRTFWEDLAYDHDLIGNRLEARVRGSLGGREYQWLAGVDVASTDFASPRNYSDPFGLQQPVDPLDPPPVDFFDFGRPRERARETTMSQWAVFAEGEAQLVSDLRAHVAVRHDRIDADFTRFDQTPTSSYQARYRPTTGSAGVSVPVWNGARGYVSAGTSATPADSLLVIGDPTGAAYELTRGRSIEGGVKQVVAGGRGHWTAAVYRLEQRHVPTADPGDPSRALQIGRQRSVGLELSGAYAPGPRWRVEANLAALDAAYVEFREGDADRAGKLPPNVPELVANVFVEYFPGRGVTVGGAWRHVGPIAANTSNSIVLPSYRVLDLKAGYAFNAKADLLLFVRNVTDALYAHWATGAGGQNAMANVGEPRTVEVALRLRL